MSCVSQTLAGLMQDCENSKGGIKKVYIATKNPNPIYRSEPIDLDLRWYGFAIVEVGGKYKYSEDIVNPTDSTSIIVSKGDIIEITLPSITQTTLVRIAISKSYGAGREILELINYNVTKQNKKISLKIGESIGKSITDTGHLSIHLPSSTPTDGSKAYNLKDLGKILNFDNGVRWYEYNFKKNTSSFTSTLNIDPANGINFVSTELILQFNKMNTTKRIEMASLAVNDMYVIVEDCNNKYWYLGMDEPVTATSGTSQTGTVKSDGNFYQITLTDESKTWLYEVSKDALPIMLQGWVGSSLSAALRNDNAVSIVEGELKFGNKIKLRANVAHKKTTLWDKDKQMAIGPNNIGTGEITLNDPNRTVYNIAVMLEI